MTTTPRTAVLARETPCVTDDWAGVLPPGVYLIVDVDQPDGPDQAGTLFVDADGERVEINALAAGLRIAEGTTPFEHPEMPPEFTTGFVVGTCGHRVAGSEWLAGMHTCERCS